WFWRSDRSSHEPCPKLAADTDAHAAGGAFDHSLRRREVERVQVLHFELSDFADFIPGDLANRRRVGTTGALVDANRLLQEIGSRRRLGHKRKGPIFEHRYLDRHD